MEHCNLKNKILLPFGKKLKKERKIPTGDVQLLTPEKLSLTKKLKSKNITTRIIKYGKF